MNSLLAQDPAQRPSIAEVKAHPWFNGPALTYEQLNNEFLIRKQRVDAELEKARLQKLMQKEQKKNQ